MNWSFRAENLIILVDRKQMIFRRGIPDRRYRFFLIANSRPDINMNRLFKAATDARHCVDTDNLKRQCVTLAGRQCHLRRNR